MPTNTDYEFELDKARSEPSEPSIIPIGKSYPADKKELQVVILTYQNSASSSRLRPRRSSPFEREYSDRESLARQFRELAEAWRSRKGPISSIARMAILPEYQQIMAMGPPIIPIILRELQRKPDHWFWALHYLTKADPVREDELGNLRKMADAWIRWGKENGYLH